jgi:hypothetical protein
LGQSEKVDPGRNTIDLVAFDHNKLRVRIGQDKGAPLHRLVKVNRNVGCACAHDSNHRNDKLRRPRKCNAHEITRTNPPHFELTRECVRAQEELAVRYPTLAIDNCDCIVTKARDRFQAVPQQV